MTRRTKIVATLGPASEHPAVIRDMITAGVDVFRLNLSHGDVESHLQRLADVRAVAAELDKHVGVLADLPGPKIRAGRFPDGGVTLDPARLARFRNRDGGIRRAESVGNTDDDSPDATPSAPARVSVPDPTPEPDDGDDGAA